MGWCWWWRYFGTSLISSNSQNYRPGASTYYPVLHRYLRTPYCLIGQSGKKVLETSYTLINWHEDWLTWHINNNYPQCLPSLNLLVPSGYILKTYLFIPFQILHTNSVRLREYRSNIPQPILYQWRQRSGVTQTTLEPPGKDRWLPILQSRPQGCGKATIW